MLALLPTASLRASLRAAVRLVAQPLLPLSGACASTWIWFPPSPRSCCPGRHSPSPLWWLAETGRPLTDGTTPQHSGAERAGRLQTNVGVETGTCLPWVASGTRLCVHLGVSLQCLPPLPTIACGWQHTFTYKLGRCFNRASSTTRGCFPTAHRYDLPRYRLATPSTVVTGDAFPFCPYLIRRHFTIPLHHPCLPLTHPKHPRANTRMPAPARTRRGWNFYGDHDWRGPGTHFSPASCTPCTHHPPHLPHTCRAPAAGRTYCCDRLFNMPVARTSLATGAADVPSGTTPTASPFHSYLIGYLDSIMYIALCHEHYISMPWSPRLRPATPHLHFMYVPLAMQHYSLLVPQAGLSPSLPAA